MRITFLVLILTGQLCLAGPVAEPTVVGEWSEPTNGLRGRLAFGEGAIQYGVRMGLVFLQLQNVPPGDTIFVYYNVKTSPLKCKLRDSAGKSVNSFPGPGSDWMPDPCWLALPTYSTLSFITGSKSYRPNHPCLFIVTSFVESAWALPISGTNDYYLSGMFTATFPSDAAPPTADKRPRVWAGTLKLPPVKISVASEK
jgi:hypothetical protein